MKLWMRKVAIGIYSALISGYLGLVGATLIGIGGSYLVRIGLGLLVFAGVVQPIGAAIFATTIALLIVGGLLGIGFGIKWTYPLFKEVNLPPNVNPTANVVEEKTKEVKVANQTVEKFHLFAQPPKNTIRDKAPLDMHNLEVCTSRFRK